MRIANENDHQRFMRRCIELANEAGRQGNTPVGSIVVFDGVIIGEGMESLPTGLDVTGHSEVIAVRAAVAHQESRDLDGATVYSTAEPCFMCSYVIRQSGVGVVIYGSPTPNIGGVTSRYPILTKTIHAWKPPPQVVAGILREECDRLRQK